MNYLQILRKLFLYASVEKEEYNALSAAIRRINTSLLIYGLPVIIIGSIFFN